MKKPYFTTIVAFSTPSGRLHIGHALGQVAGDVASRYAELHGKKSFFPFGIHSTGKDLIRILEEIKPENGGLEERKLYDLKRLMNERYPIDTNIAATEHKDVHFPCLLTLQSYQKNFSQKSMF